MATSGKRTDLVPKKYQVEKAQERQLRGKAAKHRRDVAYIQT